MCTALMLMYFIHFSFVNRNTSVDLKEEKKSKDVVLMKVKSCIKTIALSVKNWKGGGGTS